MGFKEEIAEIARRNLTGDDWYYQEFPYVLELRTSKNPMTWVLGGQAYMVLPYGPQNYNIDYAMRASVVPTMGGLVGEEKGLLWRQITVNGTFGLEPKFSQDTSLDPEGVAIAPLSGPAWTRRMVRNYFEKYAELKANPEFAHETKLIWHDLRKDDHWVVVPEVVSVNRTSAQRHQDPWSFTLKTLANADRIRIPPEPSSVIDTIQGAFSSVSKGLGLVNSAINEGSAYLGEIRFFVAQIDSVFDDLTRIVASTQNFVDGLTDTISVGRVFISSTAALVEETMDLMETISEIPNDVRQNFQQALDGLHAIAAQPSAYGESYPDRTAGIQSREAGAANESAEDLAAAEAAGPPQTMGAVASRSISSTDKALVDAGIIGNDGRLFRNYQGRVEYVVKAADTLHSISAALLGSGEYWYDIALFNNLRSPYISEAGGEGVLRPGDIIVVPTLNANGASAIVGQSDGSEPGEDVLGTDIALEESPDSTTGSPGVFLAIDNSTGTDLRSVSGLENLQQAIQLRLWTRQGAFSLAPSYGLRRSIGLKNTAANASLLRVSYREALRQESRIRDITAVRYRNEGDLVEIDVDVLPIGELNLQTISTALL